MHIGGNHGVRWRRRHALVELALVPLELGTKLFDGIGSRVFGREVPEERLGKDIAVVLGTTGRRLASDRRACARVCVCVCVRERESVCVCV